MKTTISIWICKLFTFVLKIFGRDGTVFPGSMAIKFNKRPLDKIKYPEYVVIVTGSSGKGSTVNMIARILSDAGKKVVWNKNGSNVRNGAVTLILNNTNSITHKMKADVLLIEMDERFIAGTFKPGTITHMCITNITRDQPSRNSHPDFIYNKIMEAVDKDVHLVINADDPIVMRSKYSHSGEVTTYGIEKNEYSSSTTPSYAVDAAYCPLCHSKLKYNAYHYGHLGIYKCPKCDFERGKPEYDVSEVSLNKGTIKLNDENLKLNKKVFFAVYYTLAAYAVCDLLKIDKEVIAKSINSNDKTTKIFKQFTLDGRTVEMLESKNENALSFLQSLNYIKSQKGKKTIVMGVHKVSRRHRYNDLSWLWDINFELLNDETIDKVFCIGRFKYDVGTRLDYAGVSMEKIVFVDDLSTLLDQVEEKSEGNIYTMLYFDMEKVFLDMLKEKNHEKENN